MHRFVALALASILALPAGAQQSAVSGKILGFTPHSSQEEKSWEDKFLTIPDTQHLRSSMQLLTAHPHHVGSPYDKQNAEWILSQYKQWGWDAHIETFYPLFPTPKTRLLELVEPSKFTAKLEEPTVKEDPTSGQMSEQLPGYLAYAADGDVTAPLVYVNYGVPSDYEELDRHGVSVKGAIVIARYGHSWRGVKVKLAAEHGAVGCLIYSDPADDGYSVDETYPQGPMRPSQGVQRGSVMDMPIYPGDPLTPGIGATKDAKRLKLEEAVTLMKIPALPISYGDAQPLLAALNGPAVPAKWRGGLPITYHFGPGAAKVHLKVAFNWDLKPLYDVIATMPGSVDPDSWVIRGNHHDAWVNGAEDPISGQVALLEEARALGELAKQGWKPKRTIIYASWDGEEPALLGSTEWAEAHADQLKQHAAIYINSDGSGRGYFDVEGSQSLETFVNEVAKDIQDPETKATTWQRRKAAASLHLDDESDAKEQENANFHLGSLGSGSDYSAFFDHLGIASLNMGFGGEDRGGIYHSIYDSFYWYTHFSDTDFVYGRALAQAAGITVMRAADADLLPYDFSTQAAAIHRYLDEVKSLLNSRRKEAEDRQRNLESGAYRLTDDPRHPTVAPPALEIPPYLSFAPLENALASLDRAAKHYQKTVAHLQSVLSSYPADINHQLAQAEQKLTSPQGLPRRPWMQHLLDAPGAYSGYGAKTLPGVREAIEERHYSEANEQIVVAAKAIQSEADFIEHLSTSLESSEIRTASISR